MVETTNQSEIKNLRLIRRGIHKMLAEARKNGAQTD